MSGTRDESKPAPKVVKDFHTNSDLDEDAESQHHTLGVGKNQAARGDHTHNGSDSALLLGSLEITGTRGTATAIPSIIAALVQLGAKDSTTA